MTEASRKATLIIPRVDETTVREADHRARMALYLGVASLFVVPFVLPALALWSTVKNASHGGRESGRVGRNFALVAIVLWGAIPALVFGLGMGTAASRTAAATAAADQVKVQTTRQVVSEIHASVTAEYVTSPEHCPKTNGLDPWGNAYSIVCGPSGILVVSNGPDGARYSADDIKAGE